METGVTQQDLLGELTVEDLEGVPPEWIEELRRLFPEGEEVDPNEALARWFEWAAPKLHATGYIKRMQRHLAEKHARKRGRPLEPTAGA
ncbi:MAG: hypothetical protein HYY04_14415 [Chloroflexi bacterium]|nr:hypothetical protein [Chloroflexota bacterium]